MFPASSYTTLCAPRLPPGPTRMSPTSASRSLPTKSLMGFPLFLNIFPPCWKPRRVNSAGSFPVASKLFVIRAMSFAAPPGIFGATVHPAAPILPSFHFLLSRSGDTATLARWQASGGRILAEVGFGGCGRFGLRCGRRQHRNCADAISPPCPQGVPLPAARLRCRGGSSTVCYRLATLPRSPMSHRGC